MASLLKKRSQSIAKKVQKLTNNYVTNIHRRYIRFRSIHIDNFAFIHINKTAGTSILSALNLHYKEHLTAQEKREQLGEVNWNERFTFTFVRNPWDRIASLYNYRLLRKMAGFDKNIIPFPDWVETVYVQHDPLYSKASKPHMLGLQLDWITDEDGQVIVDYIGRFENLHEDFSEVCSQIGVSVKLPHLNKSSRAAYQSQYDDKSREIIRNVFAKDIEFFGYTFD